MFENKEPQKEAIAHPNINDDDDDLSNEKKELIYKKKINSLGLK